MAGGFVIWFGLTTLLSLRNPGNDSLVDALFPAIGAACFFIVACFLPEYRNTRLFLSRRSALQAMAFLVWLTLSTLSRMPEVAAAVQSLAWFHRPEPLLVFVVIAAAMASYFIAKYLIRGFHAVPDYAVPAGRDESSSSTPVSGDPPPAFERLGESAK